MIGNITLFVSLSVFAAGATSAAANCTDKSPQFEHQGERYWDIVAIKPKPVDQQRFLATMDKFSGRITGHLTREECTLEQGVNKILSSSGRIKGYLDTTDTGAKFSIEVTDAKEKTVKPELMEFLGRSATIEFSATAEGYRALQKIRANTKPGDKISLLREVEYVISISKNELFVDAKHYANGQFYARDKWVFKRR